MLNKIIKDNLFGDERSDMKTILIAVNGDGEKKMIAEIVSQEKY